MLLTVYQTASTLGIQYPAPNTCIGFTVPGRPCGKHIYSRQKEQITGKVISITANIKSGIPTKNDLGILADLCFCRLHKDQKLNQLRQWVAKIRPLKEQYGGNVSVNGSFTGPTRVVPIAQNDRIYRRDAPVQFGAALNGLSKRYTREQAQAAQSLNNRLTQDNYVRRRSYQDTIASSFPNTQVVTYPMLRSVGPRRFVHFEPTGAEQGSSDSYKPNETMESQHDTPPEEEVVSRRKSKKQGLLSKARQSSGWRAPGPKAMCIALFSWFG